MKIAKIL